MLIFDPYAVKDYILFDDGIFGANKGLPLLEHNINMRLLVKTTFEADCLTFK